MPSSPSATTVEVVALLGGSVVGIRHARDPRSGRTRPITRALLAGGTIALVTALVVFLIAAAIAADNDARHHAWLEAGKPAWAFRPRLVPVALDLVAFGGLGLGLGAIAWGLARRRAEREPNGVRIGNTSGVDFAVDGVPGGSHALVAPATGPGAFGFAVHVPAGLTAELRRGRSAVPVPGPAAVPVSTDLRLRLVCGAATFYVAAVPATAGAAAYRRWPVDRRVAAFLVGSALVHLALLAFIKLMPPEALAAQADGGGLEYAPITATLTGQEAPLPPEPDDGSSGGGASQAGAAVALEAGAAGADLAVPDPGQRRMANHDQPPQLAREQALRYAREAGVLGSDLTDPNAFRSLLSDRSISSGFDEIDLAGGMEGDGAGALLAFGAGARGVGPGGGGDVWGPIGGTSRYSTIPGGPGSGDRYGLCRGASCRSGGGLGDRPPVKPPVRIGQPEMSGPDPAVIRRYIKRHLAKISYCYDLQLLANPSLEGTVVSVFRLHASGRVMTSTATGVDPKVSSCIADVVSKIEFPRLADDGVFEIKYPFILRPTGT